MHSDGGMTAYRCAAWRAAISKSAQARCRRLRNKQRDGGGGDVAGAAAVTCYQRASCAQNLLWRHGNLLLSARKLRNSRCAAYV